jgi:hypothetical protein
MDLPLDAVQLLLPDELLIESTHACCTDACCRKRFLDVGFSRVALARGLSTSEVLQLLTLVLGDTGLSRVACNLDRIVVHICKDEGSYISTGGKSPKEKKRTQPALAGTSVIHCSSSRLFLPSLPHLLTHSCFSSSQTFFPRTFFCMPLAAAKRSHFVGGLGLGRGFSLGRGVVGGGSCARGPSAEGSVGRAKSVAMRDCTLSRAVVMRCSSRLDLQNLICWR